MRFQKKYKLFSSKIQNASIDTPLRILNFKRTKWQKIISSIQQRSRLYLFILIKGFIKRKIKKSQIKIIKSRLLNKFTNFSPNSVQNMGKYPCNINTTTDNALPKNNNLFDQVVFQTENFPFHFSYPAKKIQIYVPKNVNRLNHLRHSRNFSPDVKKKSKLETYSSFLSFHNSKIRVSPKKWERNKDYYKNSLNLQKYYFQFYDYNIAYYSLKKIIFSQKKIDECDSFLWSIFQLEFRLDVLLWRLRFFKSTFEARVFINSNFINVNQKFVKGNYLLKKGDIITFSGKLKYFENLINSKRVFFIRSFLEIDFYTNTIIILQSPSEISTSEFSFLIKKYFDLNKFRYSFK